MKLFWIAIPVVATLTLLSTASFGQRNTLLPTSVFHAIRDESSGEEPLIDFRNIVTNYTGFTPSKGEDDVAEYIAGRLRSNGLTDVKIEGFPADGRKYYWAFVGEPAWEGEVGILDMVKPHGQRIADFAVNRQVLGRYSTSADVTSEVIDVGEGVSDSDYAGKDVKGKIVLASGGAEFVHRLAVWKYGAAGLLMSRAGVPAGEGMGLAGQGGGGGAASLGNRTGGPAYIPWRGPNGEKPGFLFALPAPAGLEIRQRLRRKETVVVHALVKATLGAGEYKQVTATVLGTDPSAQEVWVKGHTNYRNSGGGNNLTGVGAVIEVARVLTKLVNEGTIPRPRRTIRFLWSAEHFGDIMTMHEHPELRTRVLTFFSVDMVGFNQAAANAVPRLALLPHSLPHFLGDVAEDFFRAVGEANTATERLPLTSPMADPTFALTGTRAEMRYTVEPFWGPSDHEDMDETSIGIPSVEYGHPLHYANPEGDNITNVDPTQMRREVTIIGATGYYLASAGPEEVVRLAQVMAGKAEARMGQEARRAIDSMIPAADLQAQYREAINIVRFSYARELAALDTLRQLGDSPSDSAAIARANKQLEAVHSANLAAFRETAAQLASDRKTTLREPQPSEDERRLAGFVVTRNGNVRGPVNLYRPEYGAIWLAEKLDDVNFAAKLRMAQEGRFTGFEALNFVNGKRNMLEIRDLASAEYGPLAPDVVEEYFRILEKAGVVSIAPAPGR